MPKALKKKTKEASRGQAATPSSAELFSEPEDTFAQLDEFKPEKPEPRPNIKLLQHNKEFRQDCFIEAYVAAMGNITAARKLVKVDHKTVWRWFHEDDNFGKRLNAKMLEWEMMLREKAFQMAMSGDRVMIIFLLKFVNPFFDDVYRSKVLLGEMGQSIYERHPIPNPQFLPPEIPQRFRDAGAGDNKNGDSAAII